MAHATERPTSTMSAANGVLFEPYRVGAGWLLNEFPIVELYLAIGRVRRVSSSSSNDNNPE